MKVHFWISKKRCVCNVGVQLCPRHPHRINTKDQNIAFRKAWDARTIESYGGLKG